MGYDLASLLADLQAAPYFREEDGEAPTLPLHYTPGEVPLVVVVGPNASGKSFVRRVVGGLCSREGVEHMGISMEFRTSVGNPARPFVFGSEAWRATGENSARTVTVGIKDLPRASPAARDLLG